MQQKLIINRLSSVCCLVSVVCCLWSANGPSTFVENPLQINLFMQNKPNFRKSQIYLSFCIKMTYENNSNWTLGENKPNSNPNKANFTYPQKNALSRACPERIEFTLSVIEGNGPIPSLSVFCPLSSVPCGRPFISFNNGLQNRKYRRYAVRQAVSVTCRQCPGQRYSPAGGNNNY